VLGYATANLRLHRRVSPVAGVFAVRVHGVDGSARPGVASVGSRPTVGGGEVLLEAHIFDWQGDLYGRYLGVDFVAKLREEAKFPDLDALVERMHIDAREARHVLAAG
jgi:riboflavin kinase/FMN adenylyltransferase